MNILFRRLRMENYTEFMDEKIFEAMNEDEPRDVIVEAVENFRSFSESLDDFLKKQGYQIDWNQEKEKISFLKNKFNQAGISLPRFKVWYQNPDYRIQRETGFQIAFALGLDKKITEEFFQKVVLEKCFDCHIMKEAIYYYCFQHGVNYQEAQEIIKKAPIAEAKAAEVDNMIFDENILYTSAIIQELDKCESVEELLAFLRKNIEKFGYNHAKATENIQKMWKNIEECEKGIAAFEKIKLQGENLNQNKKRSVFDIMNQILGLDDYETVEITDETGMVVRTEKQPLFVIKADRSLKPLIEKNPLLYQVAVKNFPNRLTIERLLKGKINVEPDSIRKILIFVYFYHFWIGKAVTKNKIENISEYKVENDFFGVLKNALIYQARPGDNERFVDGLNRMLLELQYSELYVGNPYDWVFLYCSRTEEPVLTLREFVHDMYLEKEQELTDLKNNI